MDRTQLQSLSTNAPPQQPTQYQYQPAPVQQASQQQPAPKQDPYAHIRDLPLFPIYAPSDTEALNKAYNQTNRRKLPSYDIHAPIANTSAAISQNLRTKPRINLILTRYSTPEDCPFPGIIVDVVETRGISSWQGNGIRLRTSRECCILVRDKWKIRLKGGSMWAKNANWKPVETISVEVEKEMVPLGIVGRWRRGRRSGGDLRRSSRRRGYLGWAVMLRIDRLTTDWIR
ncbi:uncharacterized protein BDZ99DRAFT_217297 [Mytilinidion resinicola]|uniref:Uncharacterized protein n=1 Tax=Mytilinidion resinicola TaxID=574789 RepID=A0A6A6XZE2_9PEZI|nr:uncharacterized protein BDZ99DRAFT_217297 [Mytilinidion resinicola]KAF2801769.1 hypothetical protein BDZ99DRAFT_217297 [Mytilinidion resinicola]